MLVTGVVWSVLPVKICCGYKTNVNIMMRKRTLNSTKQYKTFYQGYASLLEQGPIFVSFCSRVKLLRGQSCLVCHIIGAHQWRGAHTLISEQRIVLCMAHHWRGAHTLMSGQRIVLCSWHITGEGRIPLCQDNV